MKSERTCETWATVVAGCYTGQGGTGTVEDLGSSDVEAGESLGPRAVEASQTSRTCCNRLCSLDHNHMNPVVLSMSETAQSGRWQGKDHRGVEQHSDLNAGADLLLNAAV